MDKEVPYKDNNTSINASTINEENNGPNDGSNQLTMTSLDVSLID